MIKPSSSPLVFSPCEDKPGSGLLKTNDCMSVNPTLKSEVTLLFEAVAANHSQFMADGRHVTLNLTVSPDEGQENKFKLWGR